MGRDKRKTRLDKGSGVTGGDFVGFGAFAAPSTSLKASPVYTGSDSNLSLVFKRITQKRDAITKARALNELQAYFEEDHNRKDQVDAFSHLVFVYHSKIHYDDSASVRAAALLCMKAACQRLPKAWSTLVAEQQPEVSGMMWCAQADPTAEVRAAASSPQASTNGLIAYVSRILGYERPSAMHDALFARKLSEIDRDEMDERFERIVGTALAGMELWLQQHPETQDNLYEDRIKDTIMWKTLTSSKSSLRRKTYSLLATLCEHAKSLVYGSVGESTLPKVLTNALNQEKEAVNVPSLLEVLLLYLNNFPERPWDVMDAQLVSKNLGKLLKKACHGASASQWGPTMLPLLACFAYNSFTIQRQLLTNMWSGQESAIGARDSLYISAAVAECASFFLLRRESEAEPMEMDVAKQFVQFWLAVLEKYLSSEAATSISKAADMSLMRTLADSFCKLDEASYNRPHSAIYGIRDWFWNDAIEAMVLSAKRSLAEQRLAKLLINVMVLQQSEENHQSHAYPVVRKRFHATLSNFQDASGTVPDEHAYNLMIASVKFCGAQFIFALGENTTVEQFLINDLLRWVVIHTSSLSKREGRRDHLATFDFTLLRMCMVCVSSPHKQKSLWESILREIIAAHCNLGLLSEGLVVLLKEIDQAESASSAWNEILRCQTIDNFAIRVGEEAVDTYQSHFSRDFGDDEEESVDDEAYGEDARKIALFLRTCVGLSRGSSAVLVGQRVVHRWTEIAAPGGKEQVFLLGGNVDLENPLIATLLLLVSKGRDDLLTPDGAERVVLESWRQGGKQWEEEAVPLLLTQEDGKGRHLCSDQTIIRSGAKELQELLRDLCHTSDNDHKHVAVVCHVWSERAFRILSLCMKGVKESGDDRDPKPSLALIGLANSDMWRLTLSDDGKIPISHLYLCLVYLLQQFESSFDRLELFLQSSDSPSSLAVIILRALSDANDQCVFDPMSRRDQKCAWLLTLLGGRDNLPTDLVQSWCSEAIRVVSSDLNCGNLTDSGIVRRGVSVLSELLLVLFDKVISDEGTGVSSFDIVDASDVRESDNLWYIANPEIAHVREKAQVVKIHTDDFPRLYFTIRVEQSDGIQERQTVAQRLRKSARSPNIFIDEGMTARFSEEERVQRSVLGDLMFEELVNPVLSSLPEGTENSLVEPTAECLSLIISHCGLLGKAGVGTTRYNVFRLLSSVQSHIAQTMMSSDKPENAASSLRVLSRAMGLGDVVAASIHNFKIMKFTPDESLKSILMYYGNNMPNASEMSGIDRSVLEWLVVSIGDVEDGTVCRDAISILYKLAASTLNQSGRSKEDALADSMLVMRAVQNAQKAALPAQEDEGQFNDLEQDIMTGLIKSFDHDWESTIDHDLQYQVLDVDKRTKELLPVWHESLLSLIVATEELRGGLVPMAARRNCEGLVKNLFSYDKRWFAFRFLHSAAGVGQALHGDYYCGNETKREVDKWQEDLLEEEAEELRDDVGLVGQWMPENIMNELESWKDDNKLHQNDEATAIGRMLCWLCFLSFVDSAVVTEVRFRGSVSAYLDKARAVSSVLDTALSYLSIDKDRNNKRNIDYTVDDALDSPRFLDVSKLAALVFFRSVEAFPTHTKHWWENDCPKALSLAVSQFVETKVAPETLRRELSRIHKATTLGDMSVSGSTVSREVTATYIQDECQLSIVIQIPPTFPLRNVEVDGRRTLGIPEKKWKRWALNIRIMLNNQDGTLLDALMLWKENVDKEFAGLEPCPVCYSIISVKTHELPNLQCNTCSNCFHSSCLYKWFHSSGKSQCVLCQQPWSGTRIQKRA